MDKEAITRQSRSLHLRDKRRSSILNFSLLAVLIFLIVLALCLGKYPITPAQVGRIVLSRLGLMSAAGFPPMMENVVLGLRLPRILASVLCGAALSLSGATYQGVFKNPLVSGDFLGVAQGSCIGAAVAILMGLGSASIQLFAFVGGLAAVGLTLLLPALMRSDSNIMLVLSGIIVGGLFGSILGFIKYIADPETELATITYWQMGSFSYITMEALLKIVPMMLFSGAVLIAVSWWIDVVSLGENEAKTLGVNVKLFRNIAVAGATLLTASSVCIAGTIGWVGLVVPHFGRMLVGPDNRRLLPASCLVGALFMLIVDTITRLFTVELPISILTAVVGAPFFAWLLYRQRMKMN